MTEQQFDDLAKRLNSAASRRGVLKGALAVALGGVATRWRGDKADAARRQACARLHQDCTSAACCAHLACEDGACCRPENETCYEDSDCCSGAACGPNPHGMGKRCQGPTFAGTCTVDDDSCSLQSPMVACNEIASCFCVKEVSGASFCSSPEGICMPCASNADCQAEFAYFGPFAEFAACVATEDTCCGESSATACALPCAIFDLGSDAAAQAQGFFGSSLYGPSSS